MKKIEALPEIDATIDDWLRREVLAVVDAMVADPGRALSIDEVDAALLARHLEWQRKAGG